MGVRARHGRDRWLLFDPVAVHVRAYRVREGLVDLSPSHPSCPVQSSFFSLSKCFGARSGDSSHGLVVRRAVTPWQELESWPSPMVNQDELCPLGRTTQVMLEAGAGVGGEVTLS